MNRVVATIKIWRLFVVCLFVSCVRSLACKREMEDERWKMKHGPAAIAPDLSLVGCFTNPVWVSFLKWCWELCASASGSGRPAFKPGYRSVPSRLVVVDEIAWFYVLILMFEKPINDNEVMVGHPFGVVPINTNKQDLPSRTINCDISWASTSTGINVKQYQQQNKINGFKASKVTLCVLKFECSPNFWRRNANVIASTNPISPPISNLQSHHCHRRCHCEWADSCKGCVLCEWRKKKPADRCWESNPRSNLFPTMFCLILIPMLRLVHIIKFINAILLQMIVQPSGCDIKQTLKYTEKISMVPVQGWHA